MNIQAASTAPMPSTKRAIAPKLTITGSTVCKRVMRGPLSDLRDSIVTPSGPRAKVALRISQRYERKGWTHKYRSIGEPISFGGKRELRIGSLKG